MFLLIAILAYTLNAGSTIIDKVLLKTGLPNPVVYAFFINILGVLAVLLLPFGIEFNLPTIILSIISGIAGFFALFFYFSALKKGEASMVVPVVGSLNPLFSLLLGSLFLNHVLSSRQFVAFFIIISGTAILTFNLWITRLKFNRQLIDMILAGLFFAVAFLSLKETYSSSNFITGLTLSRLSGALFVLPLLFSSRIRREIFTPASNPQVSKYTPLLFVGAQVLGALSGLLLAIGTYFANPALVNSLFGVQYLVILGVAMFLASHHRGKLLDEDLSKKVIGQKVVGAVILSIGVYLLSL